MSKVCFITLKKSIVGNRVSHSNKKVKRRFLPNLHWHKFWLVDKKKYVTVCVSKKGLKTIEKYGIDYSILKFGKTGKLYGK